MNKKPSKFEFKDMMAIGLTLVVTGIGLAYGLQVMGDVKNEDSTADCENYNSFAGGTVTFNTSSNLCTNTSAQAEPISPQWNASKYAIEGVSKLPEKLPTIVTVIVAAIIIGILVRYLWVRAE